MKSLQEVIAKPLVIKKGKEAHLVFAGDDLIGGVVNSSLGHSYVAEGTDTGLLPDELRRIAALIEDLNKGRV